MKICIISSTILPCLSQRDGGYGGLEPVVWTQAAGLARRAHKVLLIAPKGSKAPDGVELHETTQGESEKQAYSGYWQRLLDQDIILDSSWNKWSVILKLEGRLKCPILLWMHAPAHTMFGSPPPLTNPCFVAISQDQANHISELWGCNARVAYHGIDSEFYSPAKVDRSDAYLFLARMSTIKGPHIAVDVCKRAHAQLSLCGDDKITGEPGLAQRLYNQCSPGSGLKYVGPLSRQQTIEYYSNHKALLHPIQNYREPFGLAVVESMACELPVIAWRNGSMSELIKQGETGFLVSSADEMTDLVKTNAVQSIDRKKCRQWAETFSVKRSIDRIEELMKEALTTGGW